MFFGDGGQVGLVLGYLGALGEVLPDQSACVLVAASLPWAVGIGEVDRHVGGPGTGRRGRCISLPWSQVRVPFIRSGSPLTWSISASHTPAESLPLGRARIVTNRVVRPRQGDSGAAPVGADDQVALPVARHPPVGGFFGALVDADHADDRGFAPAQGSAGSAPGAPGAQHDPVLAQRRARHGAESRCRSPRETQPLPSLLGTPCRVPASHRWPRLAVPPAGFCLGVRERARSASTLAPRAGQASIIWGSWGVICAAARSRPRPRADTHKPYWLRAISRETTETSRPIRSAILRNDQPCSSPRAIAARSDIVNIRRNTTSRL